MIHPTPSRTFYDKDSANIVLAILKSEDLMPERNARYPLSSSAAAIAVQEANAKFNAVGTRANASWVGLAWSVCPERRWRLERPQAVEVGDTGAAELTR